MPRVKGRRAGRRSRQELREIKKERKIAENLEAILQKNFDDRFKAGDFGKNEARNEIVHTTIEMDDTDYHNDVEVYEVSSKERTKKERREFWRGNSRDLKECFLQSFELFGQPSEHLTSLDHSKIPKTCTCTMDVHTLSIRMIFGMSSYLKCFIREQYFNICVLLGHFEATVEYCRAHRPLLKTLVMLQVLPSATNSPKSAIHFSVFEFATFAKLDGYMSNHAISKVLNNYNMQKHEYNVSYFTDMLYT